MPTGTYKHSLLGTVTFKTKSGTWVRGDSIEFISGFDADMDVKNVVIPQLVGIKGAGTGKFRFHVKAHDQLRAAFDEIERKQLLHHIMEFGGGFNPRLKKPTDGSISQDPSNHSFGLAIDLNPNDGTNGGTTEPLAKIFEAHGFHWGKAFDDPMHYEVKEFTAQPLADFRLLRSGDARSQEPSWTLTDVSDFISNQATVFPHGLSSLELELSGEGKLRLVLKSADLPQDEILESDGRLFIAGKTLSYEEVVKLITANNKSGNATVTTELLTALIWKESSFKPDAGSANSSATGLMQMTKVAVEDVNNNTPKPIHFEHSEMTDPAKNIQCGTYYLAMRIAREGGDLVKGLDKYGTGPGYSTNILACEKCLKANPKKPQPCLDAIHP